jgi:hypothetical protein
MGTRRAGEQRRWARQGDGAGAEQGAGAWGRESEGDAAGRSRGSRRWRESATGRKKGATRAAGKIRRRGRGIRPGDEIFPLFLISLF